jgi:hypothetical protein
LNHDLPIPFLCRNNVTGEVVDHHPLDAYFVELIARRRAELEERGAGGVWQGVAVHTQAVQEGTDAGVGAACGVSSATVTFDDL